MLGFQILVAISAGSAIARLFAYELVYKFGVNLYTQGLAMNIPSFGEDLARAKSYDLLNFVSVIIFTLLFFAFYYFVLKAKNGLIYAAILIFNLILFLQIHFSTYNPVHTLAYLLGFYGFIFLISKKPSLLSGAESTKNKLLLVLNGLLTGFYLMLLVNTFTTTILPLSLLFLTPVFYLLFARNTRNRLTSHIHLLLATAILVPTNTLALLVLGLVTGFVILIVGNKLNRDLSHKILYPTIFLIIIVYNPLFFIGHFDSVEEGFWAGWMQSLRNGKLLYIDVGVYHPPLIIWLMFLFNKIAGFTVENIRLFLHALQILGLIIYFFYISTLVKTKLSKFVVILLALSFTTIMVRNNVEIRLGIGLLSMLFLSNYFINKNIKWLALSGVFTTVSMLTSVEVGIAALAANLVSVFLFSKGTRLKNLIVFGSSLLTVLLPFILILAVNGQLVHLIEQLYFYAGAFASGYFNSPVDRAVSSSFIHWHLINQFVSSKAWLWEITTWGVLAAAIFVGVKIKEKESSLINQRAFSACLFALIIFRAALGRSDYYHLLFPLLMAVPLIFYVLENISTIYKNKLILYAGAFIFVFIFARDLVNASFVEAQFFKLQAYGVVPTEFEPMVNDDTQRLAAYINENSTTEDFIFVYPWAPEVYLLTDRKNATRFDTPYAFFTEKHQMEMIESLEKNNPKFIIYDPEMKFGNLVPDSLPLVNSYIKEAYQEVTNFGTNQILIAR